MCLSLLLTGGSLGCRDLIFPLVDRQRDHSKQASKQEEKFSIAPWGGPLVSVFSPTLASGRQGTLTHQDQSSLVNWMLHGQMSSFTPRPTCRWSISVGLACQHSVLLPSVFSQVNVTPARIAVIGSDVCQDTMAEWTRVGKYLELTIRLSGHPS